MIGRRRFLLGAGASTGTLVVASGFQDWLFRNVIAAALEVDGNGVLTTTLFRPADQLWLRFEFVGLEYDPRTQQLVADGKLSPLVRVHHPSQHLVEASISAAATPAITPVDHRVAGPSRLVFAVTPPLDFTAATLLGLTDLRGPGDRPGGDPGPNVTMIEVPADLRMSPDTATSPTTARADVLPWLHGDVAQIHRTFISATAGGPAQLLAVHNANSDDGIAGRFPTATQRDSIVAESLAGPPVQATKLWLTPHGAHADLAGEWTRLAWTQEILGGRDEFVQITTPGFLMPFGHPATWVDTAVRVWTADSSGVTTAAMVSEQFISFDESTVSYPAEFHEFEGREMPFTGITIEANDSLPVLSDQISWSAGTIAVGDAWSVRRDGPFPVPLQASYTAVDAVGNPPASFSLPIVFVTSSAAFDQGLAAQLRDYYGHPDSESARTTRIGTDVAWAPEKVAGNKMTTAYTSDMVFSLGTIAGVLEGDLKAAGVVAARPTVVGGTIRKAELTPPNTHPSETTMDVFFPQRWLESGLDVAANPDGAFVQLVVRKSFPLGAEARAAMTPDIIAETLNQGLGVGPVLDITASGGTWKPADAFGSGAKILGGVEFSMLVNTVTDVTNAVLGVDIPQLRIVELPSEIRTVFEWCPKKLKDVPAAGFKVTPDSELCVKIETVVGLTTSTPPGATVTFSVTDFTLVVPPVVGLIELDVAELRAVQPAHGKADFVVDITGWRLTGALKFLEPLIRLLSPGGKAFEIDISSEAIETSLVIPAPNINLGVAKITNFSIGLAGDFPFQGGRKPTVGFSLGTAASPIELSLLQFGGGFFCLVEFSADGLERLRIRLLASAVLVTIDVKVATAYCGITVMAEFRLNDGKVAFVGEIDLEASFNVLGVIGASLRLNARVVYKELTQTVTISGRIFWSVTAIFTFKGTVPLGSIDFALGSGTSSGGGGTSSRVGLMAPSLGVGSGGTTFGDLHDLTSWTDHTSKFAA